MVLPLTPSVFEHFGMPMPGVAKPKRTRKKTKRDKAMSRGLREAQAKARKKNGDFKKGWNQSRVMKEAADRMGFTNIIEFTYGLQANIDDSMEDLDGDSMPNLYEFENGLEMNVNDALDDLDEDGMHNQACEGY